MQTNVKCNVEACRHHASSGNGCSLGSISIGCTCEADTCACTNCLSYSKK